MELRTVLQTLDSARYHKDRPFDRFVDIGHARSEAFIALLFGFRIVATANDVVDSPAFRTLFDEITVGANKELKALRSALRQPFHVFSIGIEHKHSTGSLAGFSALAADYVSTAAAEEAEGIRLQELTAVGENARDIDWDQLRYIRAAADTYFDKSSVFSRELERHRPADHKYYLDVRDEYNRTYNPTASFIWTDDSLTADNSAHFKEFFDGAIKRATDRSKNDRDFLVRLNAMQGTLDGLFAKKAGIGRRGNWKGLFTEFGDDWPIIRDWLDIALYKMVFASLGAAFPSFFTQELDPGRQQELVMRGAATESAYAAYTAQSAESDDLLPSLEKVPWDDVLRFRAEFDFQQSLDTLHLALADALTNPLLTADARETQIANALDVHIQFLQKDHRFTIHRRGRNLFKTERGVVEFDLEERRQEKWSKVAETGLKSVTALAAASVGGSLLDPGILLETAGAAGVFTALGESLRKPSLPVGKMIAGFVRPNEASLKEGRVFIDKTKARKNLFIGE